MTPAQITYVEVQQKTDEEFLFECISERESDRVSAYHFVLSHGFDEKETASQGRWVH